MYGTKRSKFYQDTAILGTIAAALCSNVNNWNEAINLISKMDDPVVFSAEIAISSEIEAKFYNSKYNDYSYELLRKLFQKLNWLNREEEDNRGNYLKVYIGDLLGIYHHLATQPDYAEDVDWRKLIKNAKMIATVKLKSIRNF